MLIWCFYASGWLMSSGFNLCHYESTLKFGITMIVSVEVQLFSTDHILIV